MTTDAPAQPWPAKTEAANSSALDQWRGLALLLVLLSHAFHETHRVEGLGRVGVNLFFFISGILVFQSLARSGTSGFRERAASFWRRRMRRLYPALLGYVAVMFFIEYGLHKIHWPYANERYANYLPDAPAALLYVMNYTHQAPYSLGHLWSVSCEMQFYLLAPFLFLSGGWSEVRRNLFLGSVLIILMGLGVTQPFLKEWKYQFQFAVWPMMLGYCSEYKRRWLDRLPAGGLVTACRLTLFTSLAGGMVMIYSPKMVDVTVALGAMLLLPCLMAYHCGRFAFPGAVGGALRWLGIRTYSIYLWQQMFTICGFLPPRWWPVGAGVSVLVGALWFHLLERPFLSAKRKTVLAAR